MKLSIDLSLLFQKSIALYKAYFQIFVLFGAVSALLGGVIQFVPEGNSTTSMIKGLFTIVLGLLQMRVTVSFILTINSKLLGEDLEISDAAREGGAFFWNYLVTSIILALRLMVIALPLFILVAAFENMVVYVLAGVIGAIGFLYIFLHYSFATIMRVLNPEVDTPFTTSYALAKKYRLEIVLVFIVMGLLTLPIGLLISFGPIPYPANIILEIASSTFIIPLSLIISVILYQLLVDNYNAETTEE